MKIVRIVLTLVLALSPVLFAQSSPSPEALLKAAIDREVVDRDLEGAVAQYQSIVTRFPANHAVASKALLRLGGVYERQGKSDALAMYERIVAEYADTGATVAAARARVAAIQETTAGPFKMKDLDRYLTNLSGLGVSPDGKYFAYSGTGPVLYVHDLSNGRERALMKCERGSLIFWAKWSPDSQRLAVEVHPPQMGAYGREWRVVEVAGGAVHVVGQGTGPGASPFVWSPDGLKLAFGSFHTATMAGLPPSQRPYEPLDVRITDSGRGPADAATVGRMVRAPLLWAADGTRLAFVSPGSAGEVIRVITVATQSALSIPIATVTPTTETQLISWTRNDEIHFQQAVTGGNDFFLIKASGGAPRKICEGRGASGGDTCGGLSPDGRWIVTRKSGSGGGRVLLRDTTTGAERPLTREAVVEEPVAGGFSPDGKLFAFKSNRDGRFAIYVAPTDQAPVARPVLVAVLDSGDQSNASNIFAGPARDSYGWTSKGLMLHLVDRRMDQYRVDMNQGAQRPAGAPVRLTQDARSSEQGFVSPDSSRIAYIVREGPRTGFALMDASGARERVIREVPADALNRVDLLGWRSLDDVLYAESVPAVGRGGNPTNALNSPKKLMLLNVASGDTREAGPQLQGTHPQLVAGGDIFFLDFQKVWNRRPIASDAARQVVKLDAEANYYDLLAPDGRSLAYSFVHGSDATDKPSPGEIRLRSLDSDSERVLVKFPDDSLYDGAPLAFSPDGRYLLYREPSVAIRVLNLETGESWPVLTEAPPDVDFVNYGAYNNVRWSPDGSFIILPGASSTPHWRAFEGITYEAVTKLLTGKR